MAIVTICQEMGWTYDQYLDQPVWFVSMLFAKMGVDSKKIEEEIKKSKHARR